MNNDRFDDEGKEKPEIDDWAKKYDIDPDGGSWRYEGINIYMDNKGRFIAQVRGKIIQKPSLVALKKYIMTSKKDEFKQFIGLDKTYYSDYHSSHSDKPFKVIHVTGLKRTGNRTHDLWEFIVLEPEWNKSFKRLVKDTKENRELLKKILSHQIESKRIRDRRSRELEAMEKKLTWVNADDFLEDIPR